MIHFNIKYNYDLTVISIAIIFPLVFTIRAAFRRREKALEHLSRLKASLEIVNYSFQRSKKLDDQKKSYIKTVLTSVSDGIMQLLSTHAKDQTVHRKNLGRRFFVHTE